MNDRGHYGNARPLVGSTAPTADASARIGVGTTFVIVIGGVALALLATRSISGAHRKWQRELYDINRPLAMAQ